MSNKNQANILSTRRNLNFPNVGDPRHKKHWLFEVPLWIEWVEMRNERLYERLEWDDGNVAVLAMKDQRKSQEMFEVESR